MMHPLEVVLETKGRGIHVVAHDASVLAAVDVMCRAHVGAVLVMEGDALSGVFSERDLMTRVVLARKDPARVRVAEVMSRDVVCVERDVSPNDALALMTSRRVRHLPVIDGRSIVGVVSIGDLVRWTLHDREMEIAHLHDYVTGRYPG
jgi:CBS domain-containing protein